VKDEFVLSNPGNGPVTGTPELAHVAISRFVVDLCDPGCQPDGGGPAITGPIGITVEAGHVFRRDDGRYRFVLSRGDKTCVVDMPGLPIDRVRYFGAEQNAFDFPRLFVDGSSWLWEFAITMARRALS